MASVVSKRVVTRAIGKKSVVVLPLDEYERMVEDMEMLRSKNLKRDIAKAREDVRKGRVYTLEQVKKKFGLR